MIVGKVAARTLLRVSTIGFSEAGMVHVKERLEDSAYAVATGFHTIRPRSDQPVQVMVMKQF